ncbi:hypothetical protein CLHOM_27760 [Clostridium homopropionicum DSM 5847]|uniref:Lipoprotein n=1 Tax=Clostridium homopropionicum DSM 5847 TaxID=1121318 RepID=A0A0L6Z796_9CLOT|nr:hypothetical protein [Clostridium homopropionicum]KOA18837.1 hypothetical protein CLHOM_27760 [Clostridium homopropionicum DSM 5847]SFG89917.1 hypothetical protein SAMN04488501_12224 [Clostridium homopropionicum]
MRKVVILAFIFSFIFILVGCNSKTKNYAEPIKITKEDEKVILEYLDTKTNDISLPRYGKMYSSFIVLGTDADKIYIWMLKEEYLNKNGQVTRVSGVSLPAVLYTKAGKDKIEIEDHKYPEDGSRYVASIIKLFPESVRNVMFVNNNERVKQLEEAIQNRIKEDKQ